MKPLEQLKQLKLDQLKRDYPNVPDYAIPLPKYSDNSANALTKCVVEYILLTGNFAERTGNEGRVIDGRKTYTDTLGQRKTIGEVKRIPSSGTKGTSDIKAVVNGRMVAIEIKYGNDKQSPAQKRYQEMIERSGGVYLIVRDFDSFHEWYHSFVNGNK